MPVKYRQPSQILTEHIRSKLFMIQFLLSNSYQKEFVIEPQPFADSHSTFFLMDFGFKKKSIFTALLKNKCYASCLRRNRKLRKYFDSTVFLIQSCIDQVNAFSPIRTFIVPKPSIFLKISLICARQPLVHNY